MANLPRLKILFEHLLTLPRDNGRFHMGEWMELTDDSEYEVMTPALHAGDCGTVACAAGHATSVPAFREAGLSLHVNDATTATIMYTPADRPGRYTGWEAVRAFFDLEDDQAYYLFDPKAYMRSQRGDPVVVARRIRNFWVANGGH